MKLKKKAWWENVKVWLVIGLVLLIVVLVIVIATTSPNAASEAAGTSSPEVAGGGSGAVVEDKGTGRIISLHSLRNSGFPMLGYHLGTIFHSAWDITQPFICITSSKTIF